MSFARPDALVSIKEKKRRIDVDLKTAVTLDAVREKKARTAGGYAEANDLCPRRAANQWQDVISGQYRAATMMSFDRSSIMSIAFDASRVGQPKEDTVTCDIAASYIAGDDRHCEGASARFGRWRLSPGHMRPFPTRDIDRGG